MIYGLGVIKSWILLIAYTDPKVKFHFLIKDDHAVSLFICINFYWKCLSFPVPSRFQKRRETLPDPSQS